MKPSHLTFGKKANKHISHCYFDTEASREGFGIKMKGSGDTFPKLAAPVGHRREFLHTDRKSYPISHLGLRLERCGYLTK